MQTKNSSRAQPSRRQALGIIGAAGVTVLMGCGDDNETDPGTHGGTGTGGNGAGGNGVGGGGGEGGGGAASCVVKPEQIEGPYFVDEKLDRADIRSDPTDNSVKNGVPLRLALGVSRVVGDSCVPLSGAVVDIWQCDAAGIYSDVVDTEGMFDTTGQKFLRGSQVTNANGVVEFITIYPGWYPGRAVHVHFKIRTDPGAEQGYVFTSQLYMDDSITDEVHALAPYSAKAQRDTLNAADTYFQEGGDQLILQLSKDGQGYRGTFDLALQLP